jgi:hypothetical protein
MTPTQYKAAIRALGLSQHLAGDWLGIGRRTSQGYALGEYPVPEPVAKLLRLCVKMKLKPEDVKWAMSGGNMMKTTLVALGRYAANARAATTADG